MYFKDKSLERGEDDWSLCCVYLFRFFENFRYILILGPKNSFRKRYHASVVSRLRTLFCSAYFSRERGDDSLCTYLSVQSISLADFSASTATEGAWYVQYFLMMCNIMLVEVEVEVVGWKVGVGWSKLQARVSTTIHFSSQETRQTFSLHFAFSNPFKQIQTPCALRHLSNEIKRTRTKLYYSHVKLTTTQRLSRFKCFSCSICFLPPAQF